MGHSLGSLGRNARVSLDMLFSILSCSYGAAGKARALGIPELILLSINSGPHTSTGARSGEKDEWSCKSCPPQEHPCAKSISFPKPKLNALKWSWVWKEGGQGERKGVRKLAAQSPVDESWVDEGF